MADIDDGCTPHDVDEDEEERMACCFNSPFEPDGKLVPTQPPAFTASASHWFYSWVLGTFVGVAWADLPVFLIPYMLEPRCTWLAIVRPAPSPTLLTFVR